MLLFLSLCESLWTTHIFVPSTLYTSVFVFVSNFVVCVNCIFVQLCLSAHSVPFCHCVSALFSLCPRCLSQIRSICVNSACFVRAHSRCLCLLSSVFAPTLLLPALCTLSVFVHFISHQDLWTLCYFRQWVHFLKIFNWTIYQLCRCILQFTRLAVHSIWTPWSSYSSGSAFVKKMRFDQSETSMIFQAA